ncbi:MAG: NUDIX domain-containing protein [Candidatus Aenigmarchaeota archaeon]|nr:NUDIX domain-containing protein [Candidatus Aenigmarchaeota archaeon]
MPEERSAGFVVFRRSAGARLYLLLEHGDSRWDFPKGNIERGETARDAALRELREETGISRVRQIGGWERGIAYFYRKAGKIVHKDVTYYLGEAADGKVVISSEHKGSGWFSYEDAMAKLKFENAKQTLEKAESFLGTGAH